MVSEKVALSLTYQAAWRIAIGCCSSNCFAASVTIEYSARIAGVVRAIKVLQRKCQSVFIVPAHCCAALNATTSGGRCDLEIDPCHGEVDFRSNLILNLKFEAIAEAGELLVNVRIFSELVV